MPQAARRQQNRCGSDLVLRTIGFIKEPKPHDPVFFNDQIRSKRMCAQMQARNRMRTGQQCPADFPARRIAVCMKDSRPAVRGLSCKGQFRSRAVELGAPFDELRDVLRAFFDKQGDSLGTAQSIPGVERVLLVKPDLVFVGKGHGDSALRPGGRGVAQIGFRQNQNASGRAQLNRRPQSGDSAAHNSVISTMAFLGVRHKSGEQAAPVW